MKKLRNVPVAAGFLLVMGMSATVAAADETRSDVFVLDGALQPMPDNPKLEDNAFSDGSTLFIRIDPKQLFGSAAEVKANDFGFPTNAVFPELEHFYIVSSDSPLFVRNSACKAADEVPTPNTTTPPSFGCEEQPAMKGWKTQENANLYRCSLPDKKTMSDFANDKTPWSIIQGDKCKGPSKTLKPAEKLTGGTVIVTVGGEEQDPVKLEWDGKYWSAKIPLAKGTTRMTVRLERGASKPLFRALGPFKVAAVEVPSRVRVQAELLATNNLRVLSYGVAVTPVSAAMFEHGPLTTKCFWGCWVSATLVFRTAGEDTTNFQFGAGPTIFLHEAFHVNSGFLFGTKDNAASWRPGKSWFVGIGLDPFLLADAIAVASKKGK